MESNEVESTRSDDNSSESTARVDPQEREGNRDSVAVAQNANRIAFAALVVNVCVLLLAVLAFWKFTPTELELEDAKRALRDARFDLRLAQLEVAEETNNVENLKAIGELVKNDAKSTQIERDALQVEIGALLEDKGELEAEIAIAQNSMRDLEAESTRQQSVLAELNRRLTQQELQVIIDSLYRRDCTTRGEELLNVYRTSLDIRIGGPSRKFLRDALTNARVVVQDNDLTVSITFDDAWNNFVIPWGDMVANYMEYLNKNFNDEFRQSIADARREYDLAKRHAPIYTRAVLAIEDSRVQRYLSHIEKIAAEFEVKIHSQLNPDFLIDDMRRVGWNTADVRAAWDDIDTTEDIFGFVDLLSGVYVDSEDTCPRAAGLESVQKLCQEFWTRVESSLDAL